MHAADVIRTPGLHDRLLRRAVQSDEPSRRHIGDAVSRSLELTGRSVAWMPAAFPCPHGPTHGTPGRHAACSLTE